MFKTPLYSSINSDILNTHIAYGIAECLIRGGLENVYVHPVGSEYYISPENKCALIKGLKSALNDMLALHFAISECRLIKTKSGEKKVTISNVSFCNGAFLDPPQNTQAYPQILRKIQELTEIDPKELEKRKIKINKKEKELKPPLSLDPTLGLYIDFYSVNEYESISALDYALAWVGFHFYSVFVNTDNYLYILCFKPLSKLDYIDILSLKDFATKTKITKMDGSIGYKYIVLRFFAELNSLYPMIFEENKMTPKSLGIIVYGSEKTKTKGYRIYDYVNVTKIWEFMTLLKIKDLRNYKYLLRILLPQKNNELKIISELLYNTIVYENADSAYSLIRHLKIALKERVPHSFVETVIEFLGL